MRRRRSAWLSSGDKGTIQFDTRAEALPQARAKLQSKRACRQAPFWYRRGRPPEGGADGQRAADSDYAPIPASLPGAGQRLSLRRQRGRDRGHCRAHDLHRGRASGPAALPTGSHERGRRADIPPAGDRDFDPAGLVLDDGAHRVQLHQLGHGRRVAGAGPERDPVRPVDGADELSDLVSRRSDAGDGRHERFALAKHHDDRRLDRRDRRQGARRRGFLGRHAQRQIR